MAVTAEMTGRASVRRGPGTTVEQRLTALELNLAALDRETVERSGDVDRHFTAVEERVGEARRSVDALRRELEEGRQEEVRASAPLQWIGTGLFAAGALAGMAANLWC